MTLSVAPRPPHPTLGPYPAHREYPAFFDKILFSPSRFTDKDLERIAATFGQGYADLCAKDPRDALLEVMEVMDMGDTPDDLAWPTEDGKGEWLP